MSQWGKNDTANNSIKWAVDAIGVKTGNSQVLFANNTTGAFVPNQKVGLYNIDQTEVAAAPGSSKGWVLKREGTGGRAGRVTYETLVSFAAGSPGGAVPRAPYMGIVGKRGALPIARAAGQRQVMSRTVYTAPHDLAGPRPKIPLGWYKPASGIEVVDTGTYTLTAALEYPLGVTSTQYLFGGLATGTFAGGDVAFPDAIVKAIPAGAQYAIRLWMNCPAAWQYANNFPKITGDGFASGAPTSPDITMSVGLTGMTAVTTLSVVPMNVIDITTLRSFALPGDSTQNGETYDIPTVEGFKGIGSRIVGPSWAFSNFGVSSTRLSQFLTNNTREIDFINAHCSDVFAIFGINDALNGRTGAQIAADWANFAALFPTLGVYINTITPLTNGGASVWTLADGSDQVLNGGTSSTSDAADAANTLIKAGIAGVDGVLDVRAVVQNANAPQKWKAPSWTTDGVHPSSGTGYPTIASEAPGRALLLTV